MELDSLNTLVDGFLTLAETRANSQKPTFMKDWKTLLYGYLEFYYFIMPKIKIQ